MIGKRGLTALCLAILCVPSWATSPKTEYDDYQKQLKAGQCAINGACLYKIYNSKNKVLFVSGLEGPPKYLSETHNGHHDFITKYSQYDPEQEVFKNTETKYIYSAASKKYKSLSVKHSFVKNKSEQSDQKANTTNAIDTTRWQKLKETEKGSFYIDRTTVEKKLLPGTPLSILQYRFWVKLALPTGEVSPPVRMAVDCNARKTSVSDTPFEEILPESAGESVYTYFCQSPDAKSTNLVPQETSQQLQARAQMAQAVQAQQEQEQAQQSQQNRALWTGTVMQGLFGVQQLIPTLRR